MWLIAVSSRHLGGNELLTFRFSPMYVTCVIASTYNTTVNSIHSFASDKYTTSMQPCQHFIEEFSNVCGRPFPAFCSASTKQQTQKHVCVLYPKQRETDLFQEIVTTPTKENTKPFSFIPGKRVNTFFILHR